MAARGRCERALTHLSAVVPTFDIDWSPSENWHGRLVIADDIAPFDPPALEAVGFELSRSKTGLARLLGIIEKVDQHLEGLRRQHRAAGAALPASVSFAQIYLGFATPAPFRALLTFAENMRLPTKLSQLPLADYLPEEEFFAEIISLTQEPELTF